LKVDRERLQRMIEHYGEVERATAGKWPQFCGGHTYARRSRRLCRRNAGDVEADWAQVIAGPWLAETLKGLRSHEGLEQIDPGAALHGTLRPYQQVGLRWLHLLAKLGLGACLADDMGLGKTIQVLSLLLVLKSPAKEDRQPSLLVAPASLLANWASEAERFTPSLKVLIAHPSAMPRSI